MFLPWDIICNRKIILSFLLGASILRQGLKSLFINGLLPFQTQRWQMVLARDNFLICHEIPPRPHWERLWFLIQVCNSFRNCSVVARQQSGCWLVVAWPSLNSLINRGSDLWKGRAASMLCFFVWVVFFFNVQNQKRVCKRHCGQLLATKAQN